MPATVEFSNSPKDEEETDIYAFIRQFVDTYEFRNSETDVGISLGEGEKVKLECLLCDFAKRLGLDQGFDRREHTLFEDALTDFAARLEDSKILKLRVRQAEQESLKELSARRQMS